MKNAEIKHKKVDYKVVKEIDSSIKKDCSRIDLWFYGKENENFIYFEDTLLGLKNQILLKNLNDKPEIQVSKSCLFLDKFYPPRSRGSIQGLINDVTKIKQIQDGYLSIHAACVSNNKHRTILIAAYPNVGKTLSSLQLMMSGYKYLSDDTILVNKNRYAYLTSFPSAIGHRDFLRFINPSDIGKWKYYKTLIRSKIYESNKIIERLIQPPKLSLGDLFFTVNRAKVDTVFIVEIGPRKIEKLSCSQMCEKITKINQYSLSRLNNPLIWAYSYFNDDFSVDEIENYEKINLMKFLEDCDEFYSLSCNDWKWNNIMIPLIEKGK